MRKLKLAIIMKPEFIIDETKHSKMKYILLFVCISVISSFEKVKVVDLSSDICGETSVIIKKVALAKVKFEEAQYYKDKKTSLYKSRYFDLVKVFKQAGKTEARKECLREMIAKDSSSPAANVVSLAFEPLISSRLNKCSVLPNSDFLNIMLINLNDLNNDSTIVCSPETVKKINTRSK